MVEKFEQLIDSLNEKESDNIITLLTSLFESWEDDKINLYTEIQNFELTTIYKVLNLFRDDTKTETASILPDESSLMINVELNTRNVPADVIEKLLGLLK